MTDGVDGALLLGAALLCATSADISRPRRTLSQVTVVGLTSVGSRVTGATWPETVFIVALLVIVAVSATTFATEVRSSREVQRQARDAASRRGALLSTARSLPEQGLADSASAATRTLRLLGFDSAGVAVVRGSFLVPLKMEHIPTTPEPMPVHDGLAGRAIRTGQTVTSADYQLEPDRLPEREHLRSVIAVPIRASGRVVGVVMCAREVPEPPTEAEIEVAEVLAAHLGGAIATRRQVEHQRLLLDRMDRLDAMRTTFADEVSNELRDPLTVVRGAGHTLRMHGELLTDEARDNLLRRLCGQADQLRGVVEALLDFSRFQAAHQDAQLQRVNTQQLLEPFAHRLDLDAADPAVLAVEVEVDPGLVRHAIALMLGDRRVEATASVDERSLRLQIKVPEDDRHTLMRSLMAQLVLEGGGVLETTGVPTLSLLRADLDLQVMP